MSDQRTDIIVGFGGAAGDGVASVGKTVALMAARQGLGAFAYNSYQSVIRGGHSWFRIRISNEQPLTHGDRLDLLVALNQDSLDRHLQEVAPGGVCIYNSDKFKPGEAPDGVQLCGIPVQTLIEKATQLSVIQNVVALGAVTYLMGLPLKNAHDLLEETYGKKGEEIVQLNVKAAKVGYDFAKENLEPVDSPLKPTDKRLALVTGNEMKAYGGALAGVKLYVAYPMSPATGVLHWMAKHAEQLGICVRQVEDEIAVMNLAIGANHVGVRAMCATSGGGFSLMTEALGMSGMIETPVVVINVMRAGPSTGVPTKTEQGDLTQALGASHGDYPRVIVAPTSIEDALRTIPEIWNIADRFQLPAVVLSDMMIADSGITIDPKILDFEPEIDRGELILDGNGSEDSSANYLRYKNTESGISPRAVPGVPGHLFVAATDEHDEDGVVISDVYTDPVRRKRMVDKRARKWLGILKELPPPERVGPDDADVTFVGWGSTQGVITEAIGRLEGEGITANHIQVKWMQPLHGDVLAQVFKDAKKIIMVENNHTGQFARYLRSETGLVAGGHIRKYDGEPFEPQHIVEGTKAILGGDEVYEALSTEPGLQTEHPAVVLTATPRTR